eukprot:m51a1_g12799 putative dual specificity protein phosphatase 1-like (277) ;mRNA; r:1762-2737
MAALLSCAPTELVAAEVGCGLGLDGSYWSLPSSGSRERRQRLSYNPNIGQGEAPDAGAHALAQLLKASKGVAYRAPDAVARATALSKARETRREARKSKEERAAKEVIGIEISPGLYLGTKHVASNGDWIAEAGIRAVLNVSVEVKNYFADVPEGPAYKRLPIRDSDEEILGAEVLDECTAWVAEAMQRGGGVLVHCKEGRSRSPTVLVACLMRNTGWPLQRAYDHVLALRGYLNLKDSFKHALMRYEAHVQHSHVCSLDFFTKTKTPRGHPCMQQ